jgi:hypothetical protein
LRTSIHDVRSRTAGGIADLACVGGIRCASGDTGIADLASLALALPGALVTHAVRATVLIARSNATASLALIAYCTEGAVIAARSIQRQPLLAVAIPIAGVRLIACASGRIATRSACDKVVDLAPPLTITGVLSGAGSCGSAAAFSGRNRVTRGRVRWIADLAGVARGFRAGKYAHASNDATVAGALAAIRGHIANAVVTALIHRC